MTILISLAQVCLPSPLESCRDYQKAHVSGNVPCKHHGKAHNAFYRIMEHRSSTSTLEPLMLPLPFYRLSEYTSQYWRHVHGQLKKSYHNKMVLRGNSLSFVSQRCHNRVRDLRTLSQPYVHICPGSHGHQIYLRHFGSRDPGCLASLAHAIAV
jgi:hypothetical protein